jgi:hypothetical protein
MYSAAGSSAKNLTTPATSSAVEIANKQID